jgi:hypothetical protein
VKTLFGYQPPVNPDLGYAQSLSRLAALFADDDVTDNVGHRSYIVPEIYYGQETANRLRIYAPESENLQDPTERAEIAAKTNDLLERYRYVVVGSSSHGEGVHLRRTLERVILKGPYVARHELVAPPAKCLAAAELWRFRSGLLNLAQAAAICVHLNSFRRSTAHGVVLDWSICEGPAPDGDLGLWLKERDTGRTQLHRCANDLAGFGIDGSLGGRIAAFKLAGGGRHRGNFSYLPIAPTIEPLYSIACIHPDYSLVGGCSLTVTLGERRCQDASAHRKALLEYADYAGAFIEFPEPATGLDDDSYYFLSDESWSGNPIPVHYWRPHQQAARLFTAAEALHVMKHLQSRGFKRIRRVQDLKAYSWYGEYSHDHEIDCRLSGRATLEKMGLSIVWEGLFRYDSSQFKEAAKRVLA